MLVLSRRVNEKIVLPGIDTTIQLLSTKQGLVRLGIDAPPQVAIFREEVWDRRQTPLPPKKLLEDSFARARLHELNHLLRNRLNAANLGLAVLRQQTLRGLTAEADRTLLKIEEDFRTFREQAEALVEKTLNPPPPPNPAGHSCRALVVEDDSNERELLAGFLRFAGMDVTTAGDGADALDHLRKSGGTDVLLLDMMMPRIDGAATVRAIRSDPRLHDLKIFAVTGYTPDRFGVSQGPDGVDRWFRKPVDLQALLQGLGQVVHD
jgi:carbon storage regulator CsrA